MSAPPSKLETPHYQQSPKSAASLSTIVTRFVPSVISREQDYNGAHELKMHGKPGIGSGLDHIPACRLVLEVVRDMATQGWNLVHSMDKDSMFFETVDPNSVTGLDLQNADMFCISFGSRDKLRVIGASWEVVNVVRRAI
ncbi:hypothetical protein BGX24_004017 [Mortierella sp. AD032]|nr:hypothetical protein BGX24_004017 [Mortierella sp. AD032]